MTFKRHDLLLANLDPTQGSEMAKTRPVVLVSPDAMNAALETVVVCPLTARLHPKWRRRVQISCAGKPAEIAVDQIRTVSKFRVGRRGDSLRPAAAAEVRRLISELYGAG